MAAVPWVKYDEGTDSDAFAANCFPVRGLIRQAEDGGGAWLVSQRAEQRRRFKAVLCAKPRTYSRIKEERKRAEREGGQINVATQSLADEEEEEEAEAPTLDGFFLMKHCCVEDPADLCSVNISGQELSEVKEEDFALFDNVAYVNAAENYLPFEAFRGFPIIRELEMPINGLRGLRVQPSDYPTLEMVDLSYNNLSQEDILSLGTISNLKILHLTGNNFRTLPPDLALPHVDSQSKRRIKRYSKLEILMLDENRLSDVSIFAALAGLPRLRHLNLEKNEIYYVPQLKSIEGTMTVNDDEKATRRLQRSARRSARHSSRSTRQSKSRDTDTAKQPNKSQSDAKQSESKNLMEVESQQLMIKTSVGGKDSAIDTPLTTETKVEEPQNDEEGAKEEEKKEPPTTEEKKDENLLDLEFGNDLGDLSARMKDIALSAENDTEDKVTTADQTLPPSHQGDKPPRLNLEEGQKIGHGSPPFPELTYLNLAHNMIVEEEALLAVAAWPMLVELLIHDNPLTTENSGDPPLLNTFLSDRLGIRIIRKPSKGIKKPEVKVQAKKSRKVSSIVPKIPKVPVEELLMLEAPKPPSGAKSPASKTIQGLDLHQQGPLPPIPPTTHQRPHSSGPGSRKAVNQEEALPPPPVYDKLFATSEDPLPEAAAYGRVYSPPDQPEAPRGGVPEAAAYGRIHSPEDHKDTKGDLPQAATYDRMHSHPEDHTGKQGMDSPAFFMTQVDEPEDPVNKTTTVKEKKKRETRKEKKKPVDDRYKGYEILLDFEEDPDFVPPKGDVLIVRKDFKMLCKSKRSVQKVLEANGIKGYVLFQKVWRSFSIYLRQNIRRLPPDLHVLLSDLTVHKKGSAEGLMPYFLNHALEIFPHLEFMEDLKSKSDLTQPANWYMGARELDRKIIFHAGPTNSGKTYHALKRFKEAKSAIYCGPLRMLAQEVHRKTNEEGIPCDLITGEEKLFVDPDENPSSHLSCTVETASIFTQYDVAIIDEIQMIRDPQRGAAWTRVLLGLCANEIHVCGEASAINLVEKLLDTTGDQLEVKHYERLTKLKFLEHPVEWFESIQPGDCIVTFSKKDIYSVCQELKKLGKDAAVIYGGLPPATKRAQAEMFNDPNHPCKILVSTDAIGMGLNLNIKRIVFYSTSKIELIPQEYGPPLRRLTKISTSHALQIAGRAGRYGTVYEDGEFTTFNSADYQKLKEIMKQPVEPITLAGLQPNADQVESFSYFMGNSSMSQILEVFYNITTVDGTSYFLCDMTSFKEISSMIEHVDLNIRAKFVFCSSPVNLKDGAFISSMFLMYARRCSRGIPTTFEFVCQRSGHPYKHPTSLEEQMVLEQTYDSLDLYLWLSHRFPDMFPDRDKVKCLRDELETVILYGVRNLTELSKSQFQKRSNK